MTMTAGVSAHPLGSTRTNLAGAAVPVFSLMAVITRSASLDALRDLRGTAARLLDQFRFTAAQGGAGVGDVDAAVYALAATLDELVLTRDWQGRGAWQDDTLAKTYCGDDFVGVGFYDELTKARRAPGDHSQVIEIYYYCLVAGFRGRLADEPAELEKLLRELAGESKRPGEVVPDADLDKASVTDHIREFPYRLVLLVCFTVAFVWYVVASFLVNSASSDMIEKLGR